MSRAACGLHFSAADISAIKSPESSGGIVDSLKTIESALLLAPIVGLIALGGWITLASGMVRLGGTPGHGLKIAAENASRLAIAIAACMAAFVAVQYAVGFSVSWFATPG